MPKRLLAIAIILLLVITSLSAVSFVAANFIPTSEISINSPTQTGLKIYQNTSVLLAVDIREPAISQRLPYLPVRPYYPEISHIYYRIDGQKAIEFSNITKSEENWFSGKCMLYLAYTALDNLKDGNHTLTAFCEDDTGRQLSDSRIFEYCTQFIAPKVALLSPINKTYPATNQLPLTILADDFLSVSYSIDDNEPQHYDFSRGNTTLTGLTEGKHILNAYVHTRRGSVSQTANFLMSNNTDDSQNIQPSVKAETDPLALIISSMIVFAVVVVASVSLVYFKRGKGKP